MNSVPGTRFFYGGVIDGEGALVFICDVIFFSSLRLPPQSIGLAILLHPPEGAETEMSTSAFAALSFQYCYDSAEWRNAMFHSQ